MKTSIARTSLIGTVLSVALFAGCAASATHESTGQYLDDTTITSKVKTELLTSKGVSGTDISVVTTNGQVQLSGFAKSTEEKQRAAEIASAVSGVRQVQNDIRIR
jgi:osmotically-inducible protein OsmY